MLIVLRFARGRFALLGVSAITSILPGDNLGRAPPHLGGPLRRPGGQVKVRWRRLELASRSSE